MAITSTIYQVEYFGNLSIVTPYQVPFQFLEGSHLVVEVLAAGGTVPVTLDLADFTVTQDSDRTGSLVTVAAIPIDSTVTVSRSTPLLQPTEYPESGPFPAQSHETALDRLTMIAQEISGGDGGGLIIPPESLRDVVRWEASTDRPGVVPYRRGQLGVQMADNTLWMAESTTQGDWTAIIGSGGGSAQAVFANATARTSTTPNFLGQLGLQLDTARAYSAASLVIGDWVPISQSQTTAIWADAAARATADPDFKGQLGVQLDDLSLWVANDLAPGDWTLVNSGSLYPRPSVAISAVQIDWNASRTFYKTLSANHAFTFTNGADGMSILVKLTNAGLFTPTWPAGVTVDWNTANGTSWVTFANVNGEITSSTVFRAA